VATEDERLGRRAGGGHAGERVGRHRAASSSNWLRAASSFEWLWVVVLSSKRSRRLVGGDSRVGGGGRRWPGGSGGLWGHCGSCVNCKVWVRAPG
jgi:hypothetical protein